MSHILVADSSPLKSPGTNEDLERGRGDSSRPAMLAGNRLTNNMNATNPYSKTGFTKSSSNSYQSHPISDDTWRSQTGGAKSSSSATSLSNMAAKINAQSENALPARTFKNGDANGLLRSPPSDLSDDPDTGQSRKRFKSSVEKFAYQAPAGQSKPSSSTAVIYDVDDLTSPSSADDSPKPQKKRRFRLGGRRSPSPLSDLSDDDVQLSTAATSVSASSAKEEPDMRKVEDAVQSIKRQGIAANWSTATIREKVIEKTKGSTVDMISALESLKELYRRPSQFSPANTANGQATPLVQRITPSKPVSYVKGLANNRTIGKGIQVTSRAASSSPVLISHTKASLPRPLSVPKVQPLSKAMERVKSTNSARSRTPVSVSEDDRSDSSSGSSDEGYDRESKDQKKALMWFNQVDEQQLMDVIGVTEAQAATIIDLRPFTSINDVTSKLGDKSAKGVTPKLFHNCVELMSGLHQVDGVLEKCEKMGSKLNREVENWKRCTEEGGDGENDEFYLRGQPDGLGEGVQLKDFQLHGVNWLYLLYRKECSGILADDMGLGKTAQVIAFLNVIAAKRKGPHLIVVPSSVLTNWMREFSVFGPTLNVFKYHGSQAERMEQQRTLKYDRAEIDVVITTYDMASGGERDHKFLKHYDFDACIFDEGHILKNQKSLKYAKLIRIKADWRLLLTGTPLQNNLGELVSLLKFIMPSYFRGAEEAMGQIFKVNQQSQLSKERVSRAKKMMQPFVLRRKKVDVLTDLKPKVEEVRYCEMTGEQSKIYKEAYARSKAALREQQEMAAQAVTKTRGKTNAAAANKSKSGHVLMELRKAANHPLLFRRLYTDDKIEALARDYLKNAEHADEDLTMKKEDFAINSDAELSMSVAAQYKSCNKHQLAAKEWLNSGKIAVLQQVIEEAAALGQRLIIFSQFVQTLEIICRALEVLNISYRGFTGSTDVESRQGLVDEFTRDTSIRCFLLSTRAGGVGINLTAANWVVLFDQDFNPQNDRQAADRAYRIGQEKQVTIVRLISKNTIDEQILELGKSKLKLAERVEGADVDDEEAAANQEAIEQKVEQTLLARLANDSEEEDKDDTEGKEVTAA